MIFDFLTKTNYHFSGKGDDEEVIICLHRHWFTMIGKIVAMIFMLIIPLFLFGLIKKIEIVTQINGITLFIYLIYYMTLWLSAIYAITMYLMDSFIVTNKRVLISIQKGFFHRTLYETRLDNIQDITTEITGLIPTTLHFGNIDIKTASLNNELVFENLSRPNDVKTHIMDIIHQNAEKDRPNF